MYVHGLYRTISHFMFIYIKIICTNIKKKTKMQTLERVNVLGVFTFRVTRG